MREMKIVQLVTDSTQWTTKCPLTWLVLVTIQHLLFLATYRFLFFPEQFQEDSEWLPLNPWNFLISFHNEAKAETDKDMLIHTREYTWINCPN